MSRRIFPDLHLPHIALAAALVVASTAHSLAQTAVQDAGAAPALELSTAQRQTIFQSISATQKNNAAPNGFRVSVGAHVPDGIELAPLSDTLATLVPTAKNYRVAMVEKQVMFVDPQSRQVVAVVTEQP